MNQKQRVHAALEGKPVDRFPVAVPYIQLFNQDHYSKLTGRPAWQAWSWIYSKPDEHVRILEKILEQVDFDIVQPQAAPSQDKRRMTEFIEIDGEPFRRERMNGKLTPLRTVSGQLYDDIVNQTQFVFSIPEARDQIKITSAQELAHGGEMDHAQEAVKVLGKTRFIMTAGVLGVWYMCVEYLGLTNLFAIAAQQPDLIDYMCQRNLERNIEYIRYIASAGGDAIYIDDATMTSDMVSARYYERFSLPYTRCMVDEIHRLSHKAIVIYFGGVMDRLDLIAESGTDGLIVETSMKGYVNDIGEIVRKIGNRTTLFGNIDPAGVLENGSDEEMESEIDRQITAGKQGRGFILSTGSPITPGTSLPRIQRFIRSSLRDDFAPKILV